MYQACDEMRWPEDQPYSPAESWRGLLMFIYMTGWRIGQTVALRRENVDLEAGVVLSQVRTTKATGMRSFRFIRSWWTT
jgi:integrase